MLSLRDGLLAALALAVGCSSQIGGWEQDVTRGNCTMSPLVRATDDEGIGSASQKIINGQLTNEFTGVGFLLTQGNSGQRVCTGTLVSPTRVVTAAHCFFNESGAPVSQARFGFGTSIEAEAIELSPGTWFTHPSYRSGQAAYDIAYFDLPTAQPYEQVPLFFDIPCQGQLMMLLGFGVTDASDPGTAGTKRFVVAEMNRVDELTVRVNQNLGGSCIGDSGGPAMVWDPTIGSYLLVGVTARGSADCAGQAVYARVDSARDFLTQQGFVAPVGPSCDLCPFNGVCEDGGPGSVNANCAYGTDCDCTR